MWPRVKQSNGHGLCQGLGSLALPWETISSFIIYSVVMYFLLVGFTTVPSWSRLHPRKSGRNPEWSEKLHYCLPLPGHRRPTWSAEEERHSFYSWWHFIQWTHSHILPMYAFKSFWGHVSTKCNLNKNVITFYLCPHSDIGTFRGFSLLYNIRIIAITSEILLYEQARNNVLMNRKIFLKPLKG